MSEYYFGDLNRGIYIKVISKNISLAKVLINMIISHSENYEEIKELTIENPNMVIDYKDYKYMICELYSDVRFSEEIDFSMPYKLNYLNKINKYFIKNRRGHYKDIDYKSSLLIYYRFYPDSLNLSIILYSLNDEGDCGLMIADPEGIIDYLESDRLNDFSEKSRNLFTLGIMGSIEYISLSEFINNKMVIFTKTI